MRKFIRSLLYNLTKKSSFGFCLCLKEGCTYFNIGRSHWFYCDNCKAKWCEGTNLFSSWHYENEKIWIRNAKKYKSYKVIEPLPTSSRLVNLLWSLTEL